MCRARGVIAMSLFIFEDRSENSMSYRQNPLDAQTHLKFAGAQSRQPGFDEGSSALTCSSGN